MAEPQRRTLGDFALRKHQTTKSTRIFHGTTRLREHFLTLFLSIYIFLDYLSCVCRVTMRAMCDFKCGGGVIYFSYMFILCLLHLYMFCIFTLSIVLYFQFTMLGCIISNYLFILFLYFFLIWNDFVLIWFINILSLRNILKN